MANNSTVSRQTGQPLLRAEDVGLLRGETPFTADIRHPALDNPCFVAFVRSPEAAGTIRSVDTGDALNAPGVVGAMSGEDIDALAPFALPFGDEYAQPILPTGAVRFAGQVVAAVVAESQAQAVDAAELVSVDIEPAEPVLDIDDALEVAALEPTRFMSAPANDQPFDRADVVISLSQLSPRQLPAPMEGRSLAATEVDGRLVVWSAVQTPHAFKVNLAKLLELPRDQIRVVTPAVGGAFGGKVGRTVEEYLVPFLARRLNRAVRWNETRSDYFASATQGRGERIDIKLAGSRDGDLTALRAHVVKDGGAFPLVGVQLAKGYASKQAGGCYDIEHVEFSSVAVLTNRPPTSAYRGAGRSTYVAALERAVDRFSAEVGIDPAEVRRRNLVRPDQMPFATPTGAVYDEADYPADLDRALAAIDYAELRDEQKQRRNSNDTVVLGVGMASYNHMTTGGGGEEATASVRADGSAVVVTGTTSQGHSHAITWAQIAADVLRIPVASIEVIEGDTDAIATGVGAVGSRSLQTAGMAIHVASTDLVNEAKLCAAELLEAPVDDIVLSDAGFHVVGTPARAVSWVDVVAQSSGTATSDESARDEITCGNFYDTEGRNTFPSGAHVAAVEVDTETGAVRIRRLVAVDDAGTIVNPMVVEGQLHGGIVSAIGQVLGEVVIHDERGNQLTSSFLDYSLPTADQLPMFDVIASETASSCNALGFKGVGESGVVGATGAVHNAIVDAIGHLGVEHLDLPCTPERVWSAITQLK